MDLTPIPVSLVHPRWFFDGPPYATFWQMAFDPTLSLKDMFQKAAKTTKVEAEAEMEKYFELEAEVEGETTTDMKTEAEAEDETETEAEKEKKAGTWRVKKIKKVGNIEEMRKMEERMAAMESIHAGDCFRREGVDLLHSAAYQSIDLHKSIKDPHRAEEYAREYAKITERYNEKWEEKELERRAIPTTFPDEIRPHGNLTFKKGNTRRRAYTGREAAEVKEAEQRRTRRKDSIERGRRDQHKRLRAEVQEEKEVEPEGIINHVLAIIYLT